MTSNAQDFRVVGYLPYYRFDHSPQIEYSKLTHLCLAFANPDMQGQLAIGGKDIDPIVADAQQEGVKVLISIAGGALTPDWEAAWEHLMEPENRTAYIHQLIQYTYDHNLDGIDLDLEWSHVNEKYSGFAIELSDSLKAHGKLFTAALPGTYRYPDISDAALTTFDFINMMVYDFTGPWAPNNPGQHSSYQFALDAVDYWTRQGVGPDRLTLGVPFYGYDFTDPSSVQGLTYRQIVERDPANAQVDQVGLIFYNGIPTIRRKTELALQRLSGIMMWELGQDTFDDLSLLDAIDEVIKGVSNTTGPLAQTELRAYPNPVYQDCVIEGPTLSNAQLVLVEVSGKIVAQRPWSGGRLSLEMGGLPAGFYVLNLMQNGAVLSAIKLMKR